MQIAFRAFTLLAAACVLVLCLGQTGCGKKEAEKDSKVTKANFDKLKEKMAEKEVTDLLGPPTESKDIEGGKEHIWKSGNNRITVHIKAGKVDALMSQFVN